MRRLTPWHRNVVKRLVKSPRLYIRDSGILHTLLDISSLDILLPDGDGFEVFEALINNPLTKNIPVVIVTVQENEMVKGTRMGAGGFVIKPFTEGDLKKAFSAVLHS